MLQDRPMMYKEKPNAQNLIKYGIRYQEVLSGTECTFLVKWKGPSAWKLDY